VPETTPWLLLCAPCQHRSLLWQLIEQGGQWHPKTGRDTLENNSARIALATFDQGQHRAAYAALVRQACKRQVPRASKLPDALGQDQIDVWSIHYLG
jgi:hypothetical protein